MKKSNAIEKINANSGIKKLMNAFHILLENCKQEQLIESNKNQAIGNIVKNVLKQVHSSLDLLIFNCDLARVQDNLSDKRKEIVIEINEKKKKDEKLKKMNLILGKLEDDKETLMSELERKDKQNEFLRSNEEMTIDSFAVKIADSNRNNSLIN